MNLKDLLKRIDDCNYEISGSHFYTENLVNQYDSQFNIYLDCVENDDFMIDIGGNINEFLGKNVINNIQYMFADLFGESNMTVFMTQADVNIVCIDQETGKVGACICGDDLHFLSNNLYDFFETFYLIQQLILAQYPSHSRALAGGYRQSFIENIEKLLLESNKILDVNYFIEFFYG